MGLKIESGLQPRTKRAVIYGPEAGGKTTLAVNACQDPAAIGFRIWQCVH